VNQIQKLPIIQEDSWLDPYVQDVHERYERYKGTLKEIENAEGNLLDFASAHQLQNFIMRFFSGQ